METFIVDQFDIEKPDPKRKDWLKDKLNSFYTPKKEKVEESELITDWIQKVVDTASTRENAHGGLGLSKSRVKSYENLLSVFIKSEL